MANNNEMQRRKRDMMDGETAMAFAGHCFEQLHPRNTCPDWLARCTSIGYYWDDNDNYIISFSVTPKITNDGISYFTVSVDPTTAKTQVLHDRDVSEFSGDELHGF